MAWLGRISRLGPHCLSCRRGSPRHAKLEIRSFHFPLSVARTQHRNNYPRGLSRASNISRSFRSFERLPPRRRSDTRPPWIAQGNLSRRIIRLLQTCKDHAINCSIASILHECISPRVTKGKPKGNKNKSATSKANFQAFRELASLEVVQRSRSWIDRV